MSIPDAQILLSFAVSLYYWIRSRCTMSQYYLKVALNLSLIGCTNFGPAFAIVREYWRAPLSAFLRISCFGTIFGLAFLTLMWQHGKQPEQEPSKSRSYSMMLLNANCFVNETLTEVVKNSTKNAVDIVGSLVTDITWVSNTHRAWVLILVVKFIISGILHILHERSN